MSIPTSVLDFLDQSDINYQTHKHAPTESMLDTVVAAHVPIDQLAKGVLLKDGNGFMLAVIPAISVVNMDVLNYHLDRQLELASEAELEEIFHDCSVGAVPALGAAYDLKTIVEEGLLDQEGLYFESGDHQELIYVSEPDFEALLQGASYGRFSEETTA